MPFNNNYNQNRPSGGRPWSGGGPRGNDRFHHGGGRPDHFHHGGGHPDRREAPGESSAGHTACSDKLKELLGGDRFINCESPSLRLDKFVTIGNKLKLREIQDFVALHNRRKPVAAAFAPKQGFQTFVATLRSNLIINQAGGVLENAGISIHPHFNVPYLPGSAVKGVARHAAWCEWNAENDEAKKECLAKRIAEIFGYPTGDERPRKDKDATRGGPDAYLDDYLAKRGWKDKITAGTAVFMAAFPCDATGNVAPASLKVDILTPHGGNDWTDPIPNPFPVVEKGTSFKFAVGSIDAFHAASGADAMNWLKKGLAQGGLGAKTAAGYGAFEIPGETPSASARIYTLRLVSPAFLRGAEEDEGTLRESSLRGVLRYWWRILFGSVLGPGDLGKLQTKVWGGSGEPPSASQIVIRLVPKTMTRAVPFDKESMAKSLPRSFKQNRTSGLAYASYGMDDMKKNSSGQKVRSQRKVLLPGAEWSLEVSFRPVSGVDVDALALHVDLALKALCTFGGIGAKSRKGFGSLYCGEELDIEDDALKTKLMDAARRFGFNPDAGKASDYSFLSDILPEQVCAETDTDNAWAVVDRIGFALQTTAASYKHKKEKAAAGLPRKIHGPLRDPLPHQRGRQHTPPENLRPEGGTLQRTPRFASPLFVHVAPGGNGKLKVNAIAFPSGLVRPCGISQDVLEDYLDDLDKVLRETKWR